MESYKSTSVTKRYFNFPEIWTDQAWLARKTQCWAGASFLCYENLPHLSSPHISFSLHSQTAKSSESKLVTMVKLQAAKIQEYAITGYSIKSRVKTTTLLPQTAPLSLWFAHRLGRDPKSQLEHLSGSRELASARHRFGLSVRVPLLQSVIFWPRLQYSDKQGDRL